jgi:hypothetical protein
VAKTKQKAKGDAAPNQDLNSILQLGLKAQVLAQTHQAKIGARLTPAFLAAFATDLAALPHTAPSVLTSHQGQVQLTAAQTAALSDGYDLIKGIRTTVKSHNPDKDVLLAYGVGAKINKLLVKDVVAGLQKIIARMAAQPAEAIAFGLVADDTAALNAALAAITAADQAQEASRAAAPLTIKERNATARRVLSGVKTIAGAGMRAFVGDLTTYKNFEALVSKTAAS